eukprot:gene608-896_t
MACSKFEYVKKYELDDTLLPGCWIVIRVDGKAFTKFCDAHNFEKPHDKQGLDLMDECAKCVIREYPDARLAYGESDEYSFVLHKDTCLYEQPLLYTPVFDGRAVCYPTLAVLRDYLSWRQADTHINTQYNTCYWCLVKSGKTPAEAQDTLKGTDTAFKNELLFSQFGINYAHLPEQFRK